MKNCPNSKYLAIITFIIIVGSVGCKNEKHREQITETPKIKVDTLVDAIDTSTYIEKDTPTQIIEINKNDLPTEPRFDAATWSELTPENGFVLDIRYATTNNFTKKQIYDCGKCFMRPEAAEKLKIIQAELKEKYGYGLKIFDCYRPGPYQQRLWDIVPDPDYVTPPTKGSMHSKGLAIDLTLVDKDGNELDMGTEFDFFGPEAHQGYNHSDAVKRNRWILKSAMEKYGFGSIRTEWWHFSYKLKSYPLDKWVWECKE